jgi:hypothetical protein
MANKASINRWVWTDLAGELVQDPSETPFSAEEHQRRINGKLWGPYFARLIPVEVLSDLKGDLQNTVVSVRSIASGKSHGKVYELLHRLTLPWYEGCLVVDTMQRHSVKPSWLDQQLETIVHGFRQRQTNKDFNSYLYVKSKLLQVAVTGPSFLGGDGNEHNHRRQTSAKQLELVAGTDIEPDRYGATEVVGYLPPWEAILHKKCGLYQDYYLIKWAPPHDTANLADTESGSDMPGCSWEPDECLPEDMDADRISAKSTWLSRQKLFERQWLLEPPPSASPSPPEARPSISPPEVQPAPKPPKRPPPYVEPEEVRVGREKILRMTVNLQGQPVYSDFHSPYQKHGWDRKPPSDSRQTDEAKIKVGWPKQLSDYPRGYGPATPPGLCKPTCDCMEDWHLGRGFYETKEQNQPHNATRAGACKKMLDDFSKSGLVNKRGLVSMQCYFEVIQLQRITPPEHRNNAWQVNRQCQMLLQELAYQVPLHAFFNASAESTCELLIPCITPSFLNGGLVPNRYHLSSPSEWLTMEPSGQLRVTAADLPKLPKAGQELPIDLIFDNIPAAASKTRYVLTIRDHGSETKGQAVLSGLTLKLAETIQALKLTKRFKDALEKRLRPMLDVRSGKPREASLGDWVRAVSQAAQVSDYFSNANHNLH